MIEFETPDFHRKFSLKHQNGPSDKKEPENTYKHNNGLWIRIIKLSTKFDLIPSETAKFQAINVENHILNGQAKIYTQII